MLVEEIRIALRRSVLAPFGIPGSIISCRALPPLADYLISKAERAQSAEDAELHLAIAEACSNWDLDLPIIVGRGARKRVRETLLMRKIDVPVLAYEEVCDYELDIVQLVDIPEHLFGLPQISNSSSKNIQDQTV
jgi:threonine/homoserine efflux transporter RhtA